MIYRHRMRLPTARVKPPELLWFKPLAALHNLSAV